MISVVVISKDEPSLDDTLTALAAQTGPLGTGAELVVVDASAGRLDAVRRAHRDVLWIDFDQPPGVRVTIAQQRNVGVRAAHGDVVVFTDAGCEPGDGWLGRLTAPIVCGDEQMAAGIARVRGERQAVFDTPTAVREGVAGVEYLTECPTVNMALTRAVFERVGGFDESFSYGSDIDFSWRARDAGFRIRRVPDAVVAHDWGPTRRQMRRAYAYGQARVSLFVKHASRRRQMLRSDGIYPAFLLGLPITVLIPFYPAVLLVPAWNHRHEAPLRVVTLRLCFGAGILTGFAKRRRTRR